MYNIYKAKITQFGQPALIIATSISKHGRLNGEVFCVFPSPNPVITINKFYFLEADFADIPNTLNDEFIFEEALARARDEFSSHIQQYFADKTWLVSYSDPQLVSGLGFLTQVRLMDTLNNLQKIYDQTESSELQKTLTPILRLQPLEDHSI